MSMKAQLRTAVALGAVLLGGVAHAGSDPTRRSGHAPGSERPEPGEWLPAGPVDPRLSIGQTSFPQVQEVERVTAPTGAGSTRWPTGEIAKGVYISVMPACIPGVDEPLGPVSRRTVPPRSRR